MERQESFTLSTFTDLYDSIIPKDNFLRRMNELADFLFVIDELKERYCLNNGRNADSPVRIFKYLLLKVIYDIGCRRSRAI